MKSGVLMTISWAFAQKEQVVNFKMNCVRNVHSTCGVSGVEYRRRLLFA